MSPAWTKPRPAGRPRVVTDPEFAYADAHRVCLDTETGACVWTEELAGTAAGIGIDVAIETVDEPMPDDLFPEHKGLLRRRWDRSRRMARSRKRWLRVQALTKASAALAHLSPGGAPRRFLGPVDDARVVGGITPATAGDKGDDAAASRLPRDVASGRQRHLPWLAVG